MGMALGEGSLRADPNVVPLIDVLLVLILIFMLLTPQLSRGLPASLPQLASKQDHPDLDRIVVRVMSGGKLLVNQDPTDWNALPARLSGIFKNRADKVAFVTGAREVPFAEVALAMDIMRSAGINRVGLLTAPAN
jgi:biopolymer transport protein TolR